MSFFLSGSTQTLQETDIPIPLPKFTVMMLGLNSMNAIDIQNSIFVYSISKEANINHLVDFFSYCGAVKKVVMGNAKSLRLLEEPNANLNSSQGRSTPISIRSSGNDESNGSIPLSTSLDDDWENAMNNTELSADNEEELFTESNISRQSVQSSPQPIVPPSPSLQPQSQSQQTPKKSLLDFDFFSNDSNNNNSTPPASPGGNLISRFLSNTIGTPNSIPNISNTGNNVFAVVTFESQSAYQIALQLNEVGEIQGKVIKLLPYKNLLPISMQSAIPRLDLSFIPSDRSAVSVVQGLFHKGYITSERAFERIKSNAKTLDQQFKIGESVNRSLGTARSINQEISATATRIGEKSIESLHKTKDLVDMNLKKLDEKLKISDKASTAKTGLVIAGLQAKEKISKVNLKVETQVRNTSEQLKNKVSDLKMDEKIRNANETMQNGIMFGWNYLKTTITTAFQPDEDRSRYSPNPRGGSSTNESNDNFDDIMSSYVERNNNSSPGPNNTNSNIKAPPPPYDPTKKYN